MNGNDVQPGRKSVADAPAPVRDPLIDPAVKAGIAPAALTLTPIVHESVPERPVMLVKEAPAPGEKPVVVAPVPIVTREMTIDERVAVLENDVEELRKLAHVLAGSVPPSLASEHAFYEYPKDRRRWVDGKVAETRTVHSAEEEKELGSGWDDPSPDDAAKASAKHDEQVASAPPAKPTPAPAKAPGPQA
jgi:hypothetical protein